MEKDFDFTEVVARFLTHKYPEERRELVALAQSEVTHNRVFKNFLAEVTANAIEQMYTPVGCVALGVTYGIVLGILLERERAERKRRVV